MDPVFFARQAATAASPSPSAAAAAAALGPPPVEAQTTIFVVLLPSVSYALLVNVILYSAWIGAVMLDVIGNAGFDYHLLRKPGWLNLGKSVGRLSYFLSRYFSLAFLVSTLCTFSIKWNSCRALANTVNVFFVLGLSFTQFVFLYRTLIIWRFDKRIFVPCTALYLCNIAGAVTVLIKGHSMPLPGTQDPSSGGQWCIYMSEPNSMFLFYTASSLAFDIAIFVATTKKLLDDDIFTFLKRRSTFVNVSEVSRALLAKGMIYFLGNVSIGIIVLVMAVSTSDDAYKTVNLSTVAGGTSILGAAVYRAAFKAAGQMRRKSGSVPPYSGGSGSGPHHGGAHGLGIFDRRHTSTIGGSLPAGSKGGAGAGFRSAGGGGGGGLEGKASGDASDFIEMEPASPTTPTTTTTRHTSRSILRGMPNSPSVDHLGNPLLVYVTTEREVFDAAATDGRGGIGVGGGGGRRDLPVYEEEEDDGEGDGETRDGHADALSTRAASDVDPMPTPPPAVFQSPSVQWSTAFGSAH